MNNVISPQITIDDVSRTWSAVVIGSGPAGTAAAIELSRTGLDTLLVERKSIPRGKVCGGCVNLSALESLGKLGVADALHNSGAQPLQSFRLFARGRQAMLPLPGGVSVTRHCMDEILTREAIRSGAQFLPETTVSVRGCDDDHRYLTLVNAGKSVELKARVVIVAAGLAGQQMCSSDVAIRQATGSRVGLGLVTDHVPDVVQEGSICMAVGRDGYVGLAQAENGLLSIAAAVDPKLAGNLGQAGVCQRILDDAGVDFVLASLTGNWHGTVQLTRKPDAPASRRLLCIGDSAGYVEPFTGEGMAWALRSGRMVAPVATRGVERWDTEIESEWCEIHRVHIRRRQRLCRWIARGLRYPWVVSQALTVGRYTPWLLTPVIKHISGKTMS